MYVAQCCTSQPSLAGVRAAALSGLASTTIPLQAIKLDLCVPGTKSKMPKLRLDSECYRLTTTVSSFLSSHLLPSRVTLNKVERQFSPCYCPVVVRSCQH